MKKKTYLCIDLKSFYASAECADRGLDPFTTNLVVADPTRGPGALCLAVTPALKELGVRNRCRIFEIPRDIAYITAMPRMHRYMEVSAEVYGIYLKYMSEEDIYPYSIDECFFDITPYSSLYGTDAVKIAKMLMKAVFDETKISATAGVGTNLFLAKIAMDIIAKHVPSHIGCLDEASFKKELWHHRPITDIWNIGPGTARRLERMGVYDLYGVTRLSEKALYHVFGKNAVYLIEHAWGRESCTLADIRNYRPKHQSIHTSQVLFSDYTFKNAELLMEEMTKKVILRLVRGHLAAGGLAFSVHYSRDVHAPSRGSLSFDFPTDRPSVILAAMHTLYRARVKRGLPIRTLSVALERVVPLRSVPERMSLFEPPSRAWKERAIEQAILEIKDKYGANAIFPLSDLLPQSTDLKRNTLISGHHA